ncbi:hypothetical protein [Oxobacter pfennigii]|uniref:hypothetical protein n=1 Tax=Oxobacter pfennigii TaxID=36849 RepID=UPI003119776D
MSIIEYEGLNLRELKILGKGTQGKVYRIDSYKCIKVFKRKDECEDELKALIMAQSDIHFPRLISAGEDYIIRECINGIELNKYLQKHALTPEIMSGIIELYEAMAKVGYRRLDSAIFHIFVTPEICLKLIDTAKALKKKTEKPSLILKGLKELNLKDEFLNYARLMRPELYKKWMEYPCRKNIKSITSGGMQ